MPGRIQWTLTTQLPDWIIIHDVCLFSQKQQHMQAKTNNVALIAEKISPRVRKEKNQSDVQL